MMGEYLIIRVAILLMLLSVVGEAFAQQGATPQPSQYEEKRAAQLLNEGMGAYQNKDYVKSAKLLQEAVAKGERDTGTLYDTACSLALAGDKERAFQFLGQAIETGFRNVEHLKKDSDLEGLHKDPRWAKTVEACDQQQIKFLKDHSDPNKARFNTTDINLFWQAYDKALAAAPEQWPAIFQREYIEPGSVGLKDFSKSGRLDAATLSATIKSHPNFFMAIRPLTLALDDQRTETIKAFRKLKGIYPAAMFPDSYFVIGQMRSGGTTSSNGLLMGAELFTRLSDLPTQELNDWEKDAVMEQSEIPPLVAHEAIHFQQKYASQSSLLCACLMEGSADFLGELTSGRLITRMRQTHVWANAHEAELWEEFQKEMDGKVTSRWLYGGIAKGERPVDLGYWMGYKISEAYYKNAADKKQAVSDILQIQDCKEFLKASQYAEKFAPSVSAPK